MTQRNPIHHQRSGNILFWRNGRGGFHWKTGHPGEKRCRKKVGIPTAEYYHDRYCGYVIAPLTGAYRFWIASDDGSSLLLGGSADPAFGDNNDAVLQSNRLGFRRPLQNAVFATLASFSGVVADNQVTVRNRRTW